MLIDSRDCPVPFFFPIQLITGTGLHRIDQIFHFTINDDKNVNFYDKSKTYLPIQSPGAPISEEAR